MINSNYNLNIQVFITYHSAKYVINRNIWEVSIIVNVTGCMENVAGRIVIWETCLSMAKAQWGIF
jgi:hypothetical protein